MGRLACFPLLLLFLTGCSGVTVTVVQSQITTTNISTPSNSIPAPSTMVDSSKIAKANAELSSVCTAICAYQSENAALFPTSGGKVPGNIVLAEIQPYIQGPIVGTYHLNSNGTVDVNSGTTYPGLIFDGTKWK
jgi:hypothetical protein